MYRDLTDKKKLKSSWKRVWSGPLRLRNLNGINNQRPVINGWKIVENDTSNYWKYYKVHDYYEKSSTIGQNLDSAHATTKGDELIHLMSERTILRKIYGPGAFRDKRKTNEVIENVFNWPCARNYSNAKRLGVGRPQVWRTMKDELRIRKVLIDTSSATA